MDPDVALLGCAVRDFARNGPFLRRRANLQIPRIPAKSGCKLVLILILAGQAYPVTNVVTNAIINEYAVPTTGGQPTAIAPGPDGALWFVEKAGNNIGRITSAGLITEFPIPTPASYPAEITPGPDGALWFTEQAGNKIGRITTSGVVTEFAVPTPNAGPYGIVTGPDSALWFAESSGGKIGRITVTGGFTEYATPTAGYYPKELAVGSDGAVWFTENGTYPGTNFPQGKIGRITSTGVLTEFGASGLDAPGPMVLGPDGALWFANTEYTPHNSVSYYASGEDLMRITTAGVTTASSIAASFPGITVGPDGALWLTGISFVWPAPGFQGGDAVTRFDLSGNVTYYPVGSYPGLWGIALASDIHLWFTETGRNRIGTLLPNSSLTLSAASASVAGNGGSGTVLVTVSPQNAVWTALSDVSWITIASGPGGTGSGSVSYSVAANNSIGSRSGNLSIAGQTFTVNQAGMTAAYSLSPSAANIGSSGGTGTVTVTATPSDATWTASSNSTWIGITSGANGTGNGSVGYSVTANASATSRSGTLTVAGLTFTVTQTGSGSSVQGLYFYPVTPCRVADTRAIGGKTGAFGPPSLTGGAARDFPISTGSCGVPSSALAYSLNVTAVPSGPLTYMSLWPNDQARPAVSTLNSFDGRVVANAAIVPAGTNGSTRVFATDNTDVILDINGYFAAPPSGLAFYPVAPCRVTDTRGNGKTGVFGPPSLAGGTTRDFPIPSSVCGIPTPAQAYSLNLTAVPPGPLTYLSAGPAGQPLPTVSTLNSFDGSVVANAAIVPSGTSGAISIFASNATDLIIDINGYFAPAGTSGALSFYPVTPCRVADTRGYGFPTGLFGPPDMTAGQARSFPVPQSACGIPSSAQAYSLNATVVPPGPLAYLTIWPAGQAQPVVSTLNSYAGKVVANAAIVPAGTNQAINVFAANPTDLILDINGYFAP